LSNRFFLDLRVRFATLRLRVTEAEEATSVIACSTFFLLLGDGCFSSTLLAATATFAPWSF